MANLISNYDDLCSSAMSEKVQNLADGVYNEFEKLITIYGEDVIKSLMPMVVNILENLNTAIKEKHDQEVEVDIVKSELDHLKILLEKEKSMRKFADQKYLESEDNLEDFKKQLELLKEEHNSKIRRLDFKIKSNNEQILRLEEKDSNWKLDYSKLHCRYTDLLRTYTEYREKTRKMKNMFYEKEDFVDTLKKEQSSSFKEYSHLDDLKFNTKNDDIVEDIITKLKIKNNTILGEGTHILNNYNCEDIIINNNSSFNRLNDLDFRDDNKILIDAHVNDGKKNLTNNISKDESEILNFNNKNETANTSSNKLNTKNNDISDLDNNLNCPNNIEETPADKLQSNKGVLILSDKTFSIDENLNKLNINDHVVSLRDHSQNNKNNKDNFNIDDSNRVIELINRNYDSTCNENVDQLFRDCVTASNINGISSGLIFEELDADVDGDKISEHNFSNDDKDYDNENSMYTTSIFDELNQVEFNRSDLTSVEAEVEILIKENLELLETKNALNVVKDDLIATIDELNGEVDLLREELNCSLLVRQEQNKKISSIEEELRRLREDMLSTKSTLEELQEKKKIDDDKCFSRIDMTRVVMERNHYKVKFVELQEAVHYANMLRASKFNGEEDVKKKTSIWGYFSQLISGDQTN